MVLNMWMTIDEALKRVRSHADVLGAGVATANGELIRAAGDFDARGETRGSSGRRRRARRRGRVGRGGVRLAVEIDGDGAGETRRSRTHRHAMRGRGARRVDAVTRRETRDETRREETPRRANERTSRREGKRTRKRTKGKRMQGTTLNRAVCARHRSGRSAPLKARHRRRRARRRDARGSRRRASSSTPGPTPHSDECSSRAHFGALTHDERVKALGEAVLKSGALIFTKCRFESTPPSNDDFLQAFGFSDSDEVVGLNDEQLIDKVLSSGESGKMFHHSYRGESITDLPKIWQAPTTQVLRVQRTMWFKERAIVKGGDDMKLHEYIVLKSPHKSSSIGDEVLGVAVLDGI